MSRVRIVGGQWRSRLLDVASVPGLRPTPDRVRETLFNWLGQDLSGWRCLDAFAGSGALGMEAASRGAAQVVLLERDAVLVQGLRATVQRLAATQVKIERADALLWMAQAPRASFDLVLLDPPFEAKIFDAALAAGAPLLRPGGRIYLETDAEWLEQDLAQPGLALLRHLRAGAVHAHLLQATARGG